LIAFFSEFINAQLLSSLANLVVGLLLALVLRLHYVKFGTSFSNRKEFARIFPLIALTVIVVITVVKTSLALSLGLIGALSIVRFRTPIKEPEELAYLFVAIAIGIGLGADQMAFTVMAVAFIMISIAVLSSFRMRDERPQNLYISLQSTTQDNQLELDAITNAVAAGFPVCDIRRVDVTETGARASFHVEASSSVQLLEFVDHFRTEYPQIELSIVEQQRVPGV
jgi:uncharacterized membrane protein YhiD involved in acid resistance